MAVNRITFEDRGQDYLWWEIDTGTGRIVGCGPFQASYWASGKLAVDLATVAVGVRPRFYAPGQDPEGMVLRYEIVEIAPAPEGGVFQCLT